MGLWSFLTGADIMPAAPPPPPPPPPPEPVVEIDQIETRPGRSSLERVDFHIARFERALAQPGGAPNEAELLRWLAYWKATKAANEGIV